MNFKYWCVADGVPVREEPGKGVKLMSLAKYSVVEVLETKIALYNNLPTTFHRILFIEGMRQATEGWTYAGYLEPYSGQDANSKILNPTQNPHDAAQYLVWNGGVQYNLCGHFCVAYCIEWEAYIEDMLDMMKKVKPSFIERNFNTKNRGATGVDDLIDIVTTLGREAPLKIADVLKDRVTGTIMNTPARMANILASYRAIYGVRINTRSGRLARSGVRHWIVLEDINLMDFGGIVEVYNPFGDRYEAYEWDQLVENSGVPSGVLLPRI